MAALAPLRPSPTAENAYRIAVQNRATVAIDAALGALGVGAGDDEVKRLLRRSGKYNSIQVERLRRDVANASADINRRAERQFRKIMGGVLDKESLDRGSRAASRYQRKWARENVRLLRLVRSDQRPRLMEIARDEELFQDRKALKRVLRRERARVRNRVKLIIDDQSEKAVGEQARIRQESAGIEQYVWISKDDDRVRPEHALLHGKVRNWSDEPRPGEPVRCRCVAVPVL